jgi:hypothetical protein
MAPGWLSKPEIDQTLINCEGHRLYDCDRSFQDDRIAVSSLVAHGHEQSGPIDERAMPEVQP